MILANKYAQRFHEACETFFARLDRDCPLAINVLWRNNEFAAEERSITLMLFDGSRFSYFTVLRHIARGSSVGYAMSPYGPPQNVLFVEQNGFRVKMDGSHIRLISEFVDSLPQFLQALDSGVPMPRNGSYFGVMRDERVDTIVYDCSYVFIDPPWWWSSPSLAEMQFQGGSQPNFPHSCWGMIGGVERLWEQYESGEIMLLDPFIAETNGKIWWVPWANQTSAYIVVNEDVGPLVAGVYCYYLPGETLPSVTDLMAREDKREIAPVTRNLIEVGRQLQVA